MRPNDKWAYVVLTALSMFGSLLADPRAMAVMIGTVSLLLTVFVATAFDHLEAPSLELEPVRAVLQRIPESAQVRLSLHLDDGIVHYTIPTSPLRRTSYLGEVP